MPSNALLARLPTKPLKTAVGQNAPDWLTESNLRQFHQLLQGPGLSAVFQPILDFRAHRYLGYEGLIRGPAGSPLHSPLALFGLAGHAGLTMEFERLCRRVVLAGFAALNVPEKLFINVSPSCLRDPTFLNGETAELLGSLGLKTSRIVIELTENQHISDFSALRDIIEAYRSLGYQIAIDDLGEGFSNLRMWSEVRPEFVKIDRHFISGIESDALKFQLVRAMHDIADTCNSRIIAEGIETDAEFATVRDLGIKLGQGYRICRPEVNPGRSPGEGIRALIEDSSVIIFPHERTQATVIRKLLRQVKPLAPNMENDKVYAYFEQHPELHVLPVVKDDVPLGMVNRHSLIDRFARPFQREIYGRRSCTQFMDAAPLIVDHKTSVQEVGRLLSASAKHHIFDGFIITEQGRYVGIGNSQDLMALITDMQIHAARYANPLTQLPGNVPINEHMERLLERGASFVACYCDIDHFKPFNDAYGYRKGDDVILMLGKLLSGLVDLQTDFIGHIGGDDFMLLLQSADWEERCARMLRQFDEHMAALLAPEDLARGGLVSEDRRGQPAFHPFPALSIGCVRAEPGLFSSHHEISFAVSHAKKQAKKSAGSSLFVERRQPAKEAGIAHPPATGP